MVEGRGDGVRREQGRVKLIREEEKCKIKRREGMCRSRENWEGMKRVSSALFSWTAECKVRVTAEGEERETREGDMQEQKAKKLGG